MNTHRVVYLRNYSSSYKMKSCIELLAKNLRNFLQLNVQFVTIMLCSLEFHDIMNKLS